MERNFIKPIFYLLPALILTIAALSTTSYTQDATAILTGEIRTLVADGTKQTLPGAAIVLTPDGGSAVTVVADENGVFSTNKLAAGRYRAEVTVEGFAVISKEITIIEGQTLSVDFDLEVGGVSAAVTVEAGAGAINTTDSTVAQSIGQRTLQRVPLPEEKFQEALPLVPGVLRGQDGQISIKGTQSSQSGTLIGTSNGDDPVTGILAIDLPLEAVESVEVVSNPYSAEYGNFTGGVVQLQTRSGSEKWNFGLTNVFPRLRERGGSIRGIESIKPRLTFGGPLKRDKLFLFQTFEYKFLQTRVESLPELSGDTRLESFNSFTRIDYNISDSHRVNGTFALFPQKLDFANLNTFSPQETAANFHQRGWMAALNDQFVTSAGGIIQTTFSLKRADADVFANSGADFTIAPKTNSGGYFNRQERETTRLEVQSSYSLPGLEWQGHHSAKFGGGFAFTDFKGASVSRDVRIVRADGTLNQLQQYAGPGALARNKSEFGFFAQDKWTINPRLTIDFGIRFDRDNLGETINPAPRIGFSFSPFSDNKTVIRGGFGVFYSKIPLNVGVFGQSQELFVRRFAADGATVTGETLYRNIVENSDLRTPYSLGWNIQVEREISERLMFRVGYEQRESKRDFILDRFAAANGEGANRLGNDGRSSYRELQFLTRFRLQPGRDLFFSYARSRAVGDLNSFGGFAGNISSPIVRANEYSRLPFDAPNRILFWGDFGLPFGVSVTPSIDWRDGFPFSVIDENQDFVGPRNSGPRLPDYFSADVQVLKDFNVGFRGKEYKLRAGVKFFNLTNHFNPRDVQNNIDSPDFGSFYNGVGRRTRFKFEIVF